MRPPPPRPTLILLAGLLIAALFLGPAGGGRPAPARAQPYDIPECLTELATFGVPPEKALVVCTTLSATAPPGVSIADGLRPCFEVLGRVSSDTRVVIPRCVDIVYAAPADADYGEVARCTLLRLAYGYTDAFDAALDQCVQHPAARLSLDGRWLSDYGPVDLTELDDPTQWVGTVVQGPGSTDLGGTRTGAQLTFVYKNRFDDDQGSGTLTLSDDGCVLSGAFQSSESASRRGPFVLRRCPE